MNKIFFADFVNGHIILPEKVRGMLPEELRTALENLSNFGEESGLENFGWSFGGGKKVEMACELLRKNGFKMLDVTSS